MVRAHNPTLAAIDFHAGDAVSLVRQSDEFPEFWYCRGRAGEGWIPLSFMEVNDSTGQLRRDYTTQELAISPNSLVNILESIGGWCFVVDENNRAGWVVESAVRSLDDAEP